MSKEIEPARGATALERARTLSNALSDAARRARFATRSRGRSYIGGGFQARRGERLMKLAIMASFILMVGLPTFVGIIYYAFIAADQYAAEARFTVAGGEIMAADNIAQLTGVPAAAIIQDTQVVTNYLQSRAAVEKLEKSVQLRRLYSRPEVDWWARFNPKDPIEDFVDYWNRMISVWIEMPSGIVRFQVRAFTPADAASIGNAVLKISEELVNDLNGRLFRDAVKDAEQQLERASNRLAHARIALENARNQGGLLDANKAADALSTLINDTRGSLLQMEQEYTAMGKAIRQDAPPMQSLKARIDSAKAQIAELETKLTGARQTASSEPTLAVVMTKFAELDLERQIAERIYAAAASSLEMARLIAERKTMYVNAFVKPVVPEYPEYPRRLLYVALIFGVCVSVWGASCGLAIVVRNHMA
jgi:capsular polysaccharide transport system permease protein